MQALVGVGGEAARAGCPAPLVGLALADSAWAGTDDERHDGPRKIALVQRG
jgi:hypothetical protein